MSLKSSPSPSSSLLSSPCSSSSWLEDSPLLTSLASPHLVARFQRWIGLGHPILHPLFKFGTALGDEVFYAFWFSNWFWNVDGAVGRRVVLIWAIHMFIGGGFFNGFFVIVSMVTNCVHCTQDKV
jgi:hypothetical protein